MENHDFGYSNFVLVAMISIPLPKLAILGFSEGLARETLLRAC